MSKWERLLGSTLGAFQFGKGGPLLKNSNGTLQVRNAADSAFSSVQGNMPSATFANLPAASSIPAWVQPWYCTDLGIRGGVLVSNGSYWVAQNGILSLGMNWPGYTGPGSPYVQSNGQSLVSGIASTSYILYQVKIPSGFMQIGYKIRVIFRLYCTVSANYTSIKILLGTTGTSGDTLITNWGNNQFTSICTEFNFQITSNTAIQQITNDYSPQSNPYYLGSTVPQASVTIPDISSNLTYLSFMVTIGSANANITLENVSFLLRTP